MTNPEQELSPLSILEGRQRLAANIADMNECLGLEIINSGASDTSPEMMRAKELQLSALVLADVAATMLVEIQNLKTEELGMSELPIETPQPEGRRAETTRLYSGPRRGFSPFL